MPNLVLYGMESCMFCQKVRQYLQEEGIEVPVKEIQEDSAARDELMAIGGKTQVPCLVIDGEPLYESLDIIEWFKNNWSRV